MRSSRFITLWYLIGLLSLAGGGVALLAPAECTIRDARDLQFFTGRHYWELSFDSLSAACGVGLMSKDFAAQYTDRGRWTLCCVGVAGAMLWMATLAALLRRLHVGGRPFVPPTRAIFAAWLAWQLLLFAGLHAAALAYCPTVAWHESLWVVSNAFNGLGLAAGPLDAGTAMTAAIIGLVSGLGWWAWLLPLARTRWLRGGESADAMATLPWKRMVIGGGVTWLAFLGLSTTVLFTLESPRGETRVVADDPALSARPASARWMRCATQVVSAATAGLPTEPLGDPGLRDSSKAMLALIVLVGGVGGGATGGIGWWLLAAALRTTVGGARPHTADGAATPTDGPTVGAASVAATTDSEPEVRERVRGYAVRLAFGMAALVVVTALGLLVIESVVATRFQRPPTLADALIDASSAVSGANLSTGLTASVTSRNLVRGLNLPFDMYYLGVVWLMLAMLLGKLLPVWVLSRPVQRDG